MAIFLRRRDRFNPIYRWYYWRALRRSRRLIERPCPEGNCTDLVDPKTGRLEGGWGPVECPCDDMREVA